MPVSNDIPDPSVRRLSAYLRQLECLAGTGVERVSSRQLAEFIKAGESQVRRDLTLFGQFGRPGVGYIVNDLIERLRDILRTNTRWNVIVVGAGELSHALLRYQGFSDRGFELVAIFDTDPRKVGTKIGNARVLHLDDLERVVTKYSAKLAILAVPDAAVQDVVNCLSAVGIEGILNFATARLETPTGVHVRQVDLTSGLEQLTFHVGNHRP